MIQILYRLTMRASLKGKKYAVDKRKTNSSDEYLKATILIGTT